jgi:heme-degrading monooxygenase HmoA
LLTADPAQVGNAVHYIADEGRRQVEDQPGNVGMSLIANPELAVALVASFWVSGDAMRESEKMSAELRHQAAQVSSGTVSVEHFEVPSFVQPRRVQPGAWVRLTRMDTEVRQVDEMVSGYADTVLPWLSETPGFVAELMLLDRRRGRAIMQTVWQDLDALVASRGVAAVVRADMVAATDSAIRALEEYELLFSSAEPV